MSDNVFLTPDQGVPRPLPAINQDNQAFWTGGANDELLIYRCKDCSYYVHPPVNYCPSCEGRNVAAEAVSGQATIASFTINHKAWMPGLKTPYAVAMVSLNEQHDVRLVSNIVNCCVDDIHIGMPVEVFFEPQEELWIPLFQPESKA